MKESLAVSAPPCPGCGGLLVGDGSERRCPDCGRAFTVEIFAGASNLVYRDTPFVDLVPRQDRMPILGIDVVNAMLPLDVVIGSAWATRRTGRLRPVLGYSTLVLVVSSFVGALVSWPFWAWLMLTFFYALDFVNVLVSMKASWDHVTVAQGRLSCARMHRSKAVHERTVDVSRVTGAHEVDGHVRVDLDDGSFVELGKGLRVPPRARRWLSRRIAQLAPSRADGPGTL